ncbi:hypothetical protein HYH03_000855 [Edaphochlamys debaryana]|uniref:Gelsolin-like domain-containing protein n=1 Tax=Edaphochlamys debaryana TaxID=47281 RepID=A0A835YHG3_9CHLO|nr:hypothetical protein HYH03_000855 [Edaphochlamys debaryana]|eukprot:KAG2501036.1 hypothetical protein HYH03_000855 [Edaphochlamys debaryana]
MGAAADQRPASLAAKRGRDRQAEEDLAVLRDVLAEPEANPDPDMKAAKSALMQAIELARRAKRKGPEDGAGPSNAPNVTTNTAAAAASAPAPIAADLTPSGAAPGVPDQAGMSASGPGPTSATAADVGGPGQQGLERRRSGEEAAPGEGAGGAPVAGGAVGDGGQGTGAASDKERGFTTLNSVHTMAVPVVNELADLFTSTDVGTMTCMLAKLSVEKYLTARLDETRQAVHSKLSGALKEFRIMNANAALRTPNKLIFPETYKYLPIWCLGLMKCAAFRGGAKDVAADERIPVGHFLMAGSGEDVCRLAYPQAFALHDPSVGPWGLEQPDGTVQLPPCVPLATQVLAEGGVYLVDTGRVFVMWLGRAMSPQWCLEVFGTDPTSLPQDTSAISPEPQRDTPMSRRVCCVLRALREGRSLHQEVFVVRQGSGMDAAVLPYFVEDRTPATQSYTDYMVSLHKAVGGMVEA